MAKKVFTTGKAYGNETEYRLYVDGNRTETRYDTSGGIILRILCMTILYTVIPQPSYVRPKRNLIIGRSFWK